MSDLIKLLLAVLFPIVIGFVFVAALRPKNKPLADYEVLAISFLIGSGLLTLEMLLLGIFRIKFAITNIFLASLLVMAWPLYLSIKAKTFSLNWGSWFKFDNWRWYESVLLALISLRVAFIFFENLIKPVVGVDAFANWSFRAKVFFFDSGLLLDPKNNFFLGGGAVFYPLNLPLLETWIFTALGYWNDALMKIIFTFFSVALLLLFYGAVKRVASRPIALLATYLLTTLPLLIHHATVEYADLPLAIYFTASALLLFNYFESQDKRYLWLSAILAGLATWTKTEGLPLLLITLLVLALYYFRSRRDAKSAIIDLFSYSLVALAFKLPWSLMNIYYHIPKSIYQRIELEKALVNLDRWPVILEFFYNKMFFYGNWNIAWFVFVIVLLFSWPRLKDPRPFYSLVYVLLFLLTFALMYYITENYVWLLDGTTLNRNTLIIMPLVVYFIAVNLPGLLDPPKEKKKR